jgi:hypothetical protein
MDILQFGEALNAGKTAIDIIRSAAEFLPKGKREAALDHALQAETALRLAKAQAAKEFGYFLCR